MKKFLLLATGLILVITAVSTSAADFMVNVDGRKTTSLNGPWQYIIDPYEAGFYTYRYAEDKNGYFRNETPDDKSDRVEYEFNNNHVLHVPGDWNSQDDRFLYYEGSMWYKKDFDDPRENREGRLFVYFGGANYEAHVYLNGEKIGSHEGGFTAFQFEITDRVRPSDNFLVVKVDNQRRRDAVPTLNTDWWNYGGLTRRVMLIETPSAFIDDYRVQLDPANRQRIAGHVQLDGADGAQSITIEIPEADIRETFEASADGRAEISLPAGDLALWSPEEPKLYEVRLTSGGDVVTDQIGFRTIETEGSRILLNGEPIFLRGICLHEEAPLAAERANSPEDARTLLKWAQQPGCNFVRLAHYPHNEFMVRAADEMGMLVWSEIPVYWTILFDSEPVYDNAENQLAEMIRRDQNRASVILWSVGNETPVQENRNRFMTRLANHARALDASRLITAALEISFSDDTTIDIHDPLGEALDVLGCNEYVGWYLGEPEMADTLSWTTPYDKPLIVSEFGAGALQGKSGDEDTMWSEAHQRNVYEHQVGMLRRIDFLAGTTPWILKDFRSPRRPLYGIQDGFNRKGLISETGQRKEAFDVMRQFYEEIEENWPADVE